MSEASVLRVLRSWYEQHGRDLPWRHTTDSYAILVSECMLQQTQVDRVIPKYVAWLRAFPGWESLARASRADVLKLWSGLGYNTRAIRLQLLARIIMEEYEGTLPVGEGELIKLPGIGPYTAGAVMVFAHDLPGKCIDVNVVRVINRVFFTRRQRPNRVRTESAALQLIAQRPRLVANALMDLGSAYCTATKPRCDTCPLAAQCKSRGVRPEEAELRKTRRQKPFLYSNRWWRGQILKALQDGAVTKRSLFAMIAGDDQDAFEGALQQLRNERLVAVGRVIALVD